ncbi:MAG: hypothetical protein IKM43_04445 [Clostridia bacterium]|nr:hypothetical protein [Clostridia bacterium]
MKKFLIFLVSIVVVVCMGMTTYYFLRNDEVINYKTKEIYCNTGDVITLNELGFVRIKADKNTEFDYNAGGEGVTKYVSFDADKGYYVVGSQGGEVSLIIKTTNKRYPEFKINLHIGDGSQNNPYYIDDQTDLEKIGQVYTLDSYYSLRNDITLSNSFAPIGYNSQAETWAGFDGNFNGNGHAIVGLNLTSSEYDNAGLFYAINAGATVKDLVIKNTKIHGAYNNIGVVAGSIAGNVNKVRVEDATITSTKSGAVVGGFVGHIGQTSMTMNYAQNVVISSEGATSVGGFAGVVEKSTIIACYSSNGSVNGDATNIGGFAGNYIIDTDAGTIQQSYANNTSTSANYGAFAGAVTQSNDFDVTTAQMLKYLVGNIAVGNITVHTVSVDQKDSKDFFPTNFYDTLNGYYLITPFATESDLVVSTNLIFFQLEDGTQKAWDNAVWVNANNILPQLRMSAVGPKSADVDYFLRNLSKINLNDSSDLKSEFANATGKEFILKSDITLPSDWVSVNLKDCKVVGNDYTIYFADGGNASLFNEVKDSSIKNVNLGNVKTTSSGALANIIDSTDSAFASVLEDVNVTYVGEVSAANTFGGLVGTAKNATISNCSVSGLNLVSNSNTVGGLVAELSNSTLTDCTVDVTLKGTQIVAGVVAKNNNSTISNVSGKVNINFDSTSNGTNLIGGAVAQNYGTVDKANLTVKIDIKNTAANITAGGVTATNNGNVTSCTVAGEGIVVTGNFDKTAMLGGIVGVNYGSIANANTFMAQIGSYIEGKNHIVGGVTASNSSANSKIYQAVVSSNIYGNIVSGVAVYMNEEQGANIDQVLVAKFDKDTDVITENEIKGDKYVAGVCFDLRAGTISNIQAKSKIVGGSNNTVSSLVVLLFPDGAALTNSTIDSSFDGVGAFYLETWRDFALSSDKYNLGFGDVDKDGRFNLYTDDIAAGSMQSVVINGEKAQSNGVSITKAYFATNPWLIYRKSAYSNSNESSFYKEVSNDAFNNITTYTTDWDVRVDESGVLVLKEFGWTCERFTKSMTFNFSVWSQGAGVTLAFLANV